MSEALEIAYGAILQANMLAGPHALVEGDEARLARILEITDRALRRLNSEHTQEVAKVLLNPKH